MLEFHIANTEAALKAWATIPEGTVTKNLSVYRFMGCDTSVAPSCGSPACFGGWLPHMEHFKALGVTPVGFEQFRPGAPVYQGLGAFEASLALFGDEKGRLFREVEMIGDENDDDDPLEEGTEHEIVTNRLKLHLEALLEKRI